MSLMDQIGQIFNVNAAPGGTPQSDPLPVSKFFDNLLTGAERGAAQSLAGSSIGRDLQGFLTQGQSQLAAQNLFGNPLVLVAVAGLGLFGLFALLRR